MKDSFESVTPKNIEPQLQEAIKKLKGLINFDPSQLPEKKEEYKTALAEKASEIEIEKEQLLKKLHLNLDDEETADKLRDLDTRHIAVLRVMEELK